MNSLYYGIRGEWFEPSPEAVLALDPVRSAYIGMEDLSDNALWNSIPAVTEGRLIEISFGLSYYNDIYSLDKQLDFIVDSLRKDQLIQMKLSTRCNSGIGGFFVCRAYGLKGTEVTQIVSMYSVDVLA